MRFNINLEKKTGRKNPSKGPLQTDFQWQGKDQGSLGYLNLRPGLDLIASRSMGNQKRKDEFAFGDVPLELDFHICGARNYRIICSHADRREGLARAGQFAVNHLPDCHGEMYTVGDQDHFSLAIYVTPDFLRAYDAETKGAGLFEQILSRIKCKKDPVRPMVRLAPTRPDMADVLQMILNCPYQGVLGRMYLEGKVLELMAMAFADGGPVAKSGGALSNKDRDGIEAAHFHLLKDLGKPPTLDTLSRIAGMNRNKLNRGFRALYGDSVFGVFRREKLDRALRLLEHGDLNVGEVAYAAGFKSHSHLTHAFVSRFGISPKSYQKCPLNGCNPIRPPASHPSDRVGSPDDPMASSLLRLMRSSKR